MRSRTLLARYARGEGASVVAVEPASIAHTPAPPYVAMIFTSVRTDGDRGYAAMTVAMAELAARQPGYLGVESARDSVGITVSYWRDEAAATAWRDVAEHLVAQRQGRQIWYSYYRVRIATVHREYGHSVPSGAKIEPTGG